MENIQTFKERGLRTGKHIGWSKLTMTRRKFQQDCAFSCSGGLKMSIEMDMEVFLADVFEELDIMSEGNRDKIEMICSLQEEMFVLRNKQIEI